MKNLNQIIGFVIMVILIASCNKENPKESQKKTPNKIKYSSGINPNLVFENFDTFPLNKKIKIEKKGATTKSGEYYLDTVYSKLHNSKGSLASVLNSVDERRVQRAEIALDIDNFIKNDFSSIAFDFLVPKTFMVDDDNNRRETMIFQIHSEPEKNQTWDFYRKHMPFNRPSIAIYLGKKGEIYYLSLRYGLNGDDGLEYENYRWFLAGFKEIKPEEWYTIKLGFKLSLNNTGFIQAWINGETFTPSNGMHNRVYGANMHNNALPYFKMGLYRAWADTHKHKVFYDNLVFGNKMEELLNTQELKMIGNYPFVPFHL